MMAIFNMRWYLAFDRVSHLLKQMRSSRSVCSRFNIFRSSSRDAASRHELCPPAPPAAGFVTSTFGASGSGSSAAAETRSSPPPEFFFSAAVAALRMDTTTSSSRLLRNAERASEEGRGSSQRPVRSTARCDGEEADEDADDDDDEEEEIEEDAGGVIAAAPPEVSASCAAVGKVAHSTLAVDNTKIGREGGKLSRSANKVLPSCGNSSVESF